MNPSDRTPREITTALVVLIGAFVIFEGMLTVFYSLLLRSALEALEEAFIEDGVNDATRPEANLAVNLPPKGGMGCIH
mgnify:FL=1